MTGRTPEQVEAARRMLRPFHRTGYPLFPLARGRKTPRDRGWQTRDYPPSAIVAWLEAGGNVGIRLRDVDLVLDVDPRNFAVDDDPLSRLSHAIGANLSNAPSVITGRGDGGRHIYFRKPADSRIVGKLPDYAGVDFRSQGSLVVGPGSRHPDTGRIYIVDDTTSPPIAEVREAPEALLALLARPEPAIPTGNSAGRISNEDLAVLLSALDVRQYGPGRYDAWIAISAACHDATAGGGMLEWLEWAEGDDAYASEADREANIATWQSFTAGRAGGVTFRTLLRAVADAGRRDLVAALGQDERFGDDDFAPSHSSFDDSDFDIGA